MNGVQTLNVVQVVDTLSETSGDAPAPRVGRRERNRQARRTQYLRTAMRIVNEGGLEALTMQRMADELDSAVGTIYTYFPSKSSLLAELQRESTDRLIESYGRLRHRADPVIAERAPDESLAALTALVLTLRFWVTTYTTFHEESRLFGALLTWQGEMSDEDAARVLPSAWALFQLGTHTVQEATDAEVLAPGSAEDRMVTAAAALGGVLLTSTLERFDGTLFNGRRLAAALVDDLVRGWGAPAEVHADASAIVDEIEAQGPLAPREEAEAA